MKKADWEYGNFATLGLGDMSEADGSIPGTSIGWPGHPPGTHEDGGDIDTAYYQLFAPDNHMRPIGVHHNESWGTNCISWSRPMPSTYGARRCSSPTSRSTPGLRVIGVDGQAGPVLEDALDELVFLDWIEAGLREAIPLAYEVVDTGLGWFRFHHHHMHISMNPVYDILSGMDLRPEELDRKSRGRWLTAYLELVEGHDVSLIDPAQVALVVDNHTVLYAHRRRARIGDYDQDGTADLMVKFDRRRVLEAIGMDEVELTLTGIVSGVFFQGTDAVSVHDEGKKYRHKKR